MFLQQHTDPNLILLTPLKDEKLAPTSRLKPLFLGEHKKRGGREPGGRSGVSRGEAAQASNLAPPDKPSRLLIG